MRIRLAVFGLSFCVVVLAYFYLDMRRAAKAGRMDLAALSERHQGVVEKLAKTEGALAELRQRGAPAPAAVIPAAVPDKPSAPQMPVPGERAERIMAAMQRARMIDSRYPKLFQRLHLTPKELESMQELLVERQSARMAVLMKARREGVPYTSDKLPEGIATAQTEIDQSIQTLLGQERYSKYQDFCQNIGPYTLLDRVELIALLNNQPLSPEQSDALLKLFVENQSASGAKPRRRSSEDPTDSFSVFTSLAPISEATMVRAATMLSPQQFEAVQKLQKEHQDLANVIPSMNSTATPRK